MAKDNARYADRSETNDIDRNIDRTWELMKKIGFAMLVTHDGDKLRARPMHAYLERESNAIYFLADARRHKDEEIARNPEVNLSFADAGDQKYVSVIGHRRRLQRSRQDQAIVFDPGESVVEQRRRSQHPRAEDHA